MHLIETVTAPNPRRVRMFLAEKGIEVPSTHITLSETKSADFLKLNPTGHVPVLVLSDGTAISETIAICRYIDALHAEPALFGTSPLAIAQIEMWHRRVEFGLFFHVAQVFRHVHPSMASFEDPQLPAWAEANRPRALTALRMLDAQLAQNAYVAGAEFSVADITAFIAVEFMRPARVEMPDGLIHLTRWHQEMAARPSAVFPKAPT